MELPDGGMGTAFFYNWKDSLKWQRLKPYEKFAEMIERHWNETQHTVNLKTRSPWVLSKD
jgi:hypothetical protein